MSQRPAPPLVLCILDGFGWREGPGSERGNAIAAAEPAFYRSLLERYPTPTSSAWAWTWACPRGRWETARSVT